MRRNSTFVFLFLAVVFSLLLTNCKKDKAVPEPDQINKFIWNGLRDYYLWVDNVPNLTNARFQQNDRNNDDLKTFLNQYTDHEKLFHDLLYKYEEVDKWSWIVDDYEALEAGFQGITKSTGYDFRLGRFGTTTKLFGYVIYVTKGSPAYLAGIKRGDIFIKVNDEEITEANYMNLLFEKDSYKLSLATLNTANNSITANGISVTVTTAEVHENPIYLDTVYNVDSYKVGYLVYTGFMSNYDVQLNNVFAKFKASGINKLILDFRYNGGGSVQTAVYMASMIYSTSASNVFLKTQFNTAFQSFIRNQEGEGYFSQSFTDKITDEKNPLNTLAQINSLGLTDLYVITTRNTASASELIINGLKPYITVKTIGTNTHGKYVGSFTINDWDEKGNINPNHKWAMQPIVLKISNKDGVSDFVNGFVPTVNLEEDIAEFLPFGDTNEPLLKAAINCVKGISGKASQLKSTSMGFSVIADSKDFKPHSKEMYVNVKLLNKSK